MAGDIIVGAEAAWMASSSVFYWVIETLAAEVAAECPPLSADLSSISDEGLGIFDMSDRSADERRVLSRAIASLPEVASRRLLDTPGRAEVVAQIEELRTMVLTADARYRPGDRLGD